MSGKAAAMEWATTHLSTFGEKDIREIAKVFGMGETAEVTALRLQELQELDFSSADGLVEKVAVMQSLDQAAADVAVLPLCEWARWIVYLLESLEAIYYAQIVGSVGVSAFGITTLEKVEDAIMQRLATGAW